MKDKEMDEKGFFDTIQQLRGTVQSLRSNMDKLLEAKKLAGTTSMLEQVEAGPALKRNVADIIDLRIRHRNVQVVSSQG